MTYAIIFFIVVLADQITKLIVHGYGLGFMLIDGLVGIKTTFNTGAALGMLDDKAWSQMLFLGVTLIALVAAFVYFSFFMKESKWLNCSIAAIAGGAVGNMIDRLAIGKVRDFIYLIFFNCNVADIAICVGGAAFVIYFLFMDENAVFKKNGEESK